MYKVAKHDNNNVSGVLSDNVNYVVFFYFSNTLLIYKIM